MIPFILGLSIILQVCAAVRALQLIPLTGHRMSWGLIAAATTLMSVRRTISLVRGIFGEAEFTQDPAAELVALTISVFMLIGIFRIRKVFLDVQRAREQSCSDSKTKSEFLANMSHEIRTPMTAILGYADLLASERSDSEASSQYSEAIGTIQSNARHLLTIINDILDMSKIEAGKINVENINVNPAIIIEESASYLRSSASNKGIEFNIIYNTPIPKQIQSDPTRLRQILLNIFGNAIKFTEQGTINVYVSVELDEQELSISVADSGLGMTEEEQHAIAQFDAFFQADDSTTRRFGGTGLGLKIANSLAQLLGGTIEVESKLGIGSTFNITVKTGDLEGVQMIDPEQIPQNIKIESEQLSSPAQSNPLPNSLEGVRILLAEDGHDNQKLITLHLSKAGAEVTIAENGQIAIDTVNTRLPEDAFDIVLMDMQMPELDGYNATRLLRQSGCQIPIIAITAHAMEGDRERCLDAGCDEYLTKPIEKIKLIETCVHYNVESKLRCA
jgi:signal transduction histidine kinase/CheY-like chemotaxis protein